MPSSYGCCGCVMPSTRSDPPRDNIREIEYPIPTQPSSSSMPLPSAPPLPSSSHEEKNPYKAPGPLGCRYDDALTQLEIQLVCPGIREKKLMKASNTDVHLDYDHNSLNTTIEICDVDKKSKQKTVVDRRYFEVDKFPSDISEVNFKLKKDCVVLTVKKKIPGSWANVVGQQGF